MPCHPFSVDLARHSSDAVFGYIRKAPLAVASTISQRVARSLAQMTAVQTVKSVVDVSSAAGDRPPLATKLGDRPPLVTNTRHPGG